MKNAVLYVRCKNSECRRLFKTNDLDAEYCSRKCKNDVKVQPKPEAIGVLSHGY